MSPDEIDAAAAFLKVCAGVARGMNLAADTLPADRDRRAILEVFLDTTAERLILDKRTLEIIPDGPMRTFDQTRGTLQLRLAKLAEEGI